MSIAAGGAWPSRHRAAARRPADVLRWGVEQLIGKHRVTIEGDVVSTQFDGILNVPEMTALQRIYEARLRLHPRLFSVLWVAHAVPPPPEVRQVMAHWRRQHKVAGTVVIGASLPIRAIGTLYLRATQLLGLHTWPVRFVTSGAEAQQFLNELRVSVPARE